MLAYEQVGSGIQLPNRVNIRQTFDRPIIEDVAACVRSELTSAKIAKTIQPGMQVAITAGSRGISNIRLILREVVSFCRERGAQPFLVPAMGSHGGAAAEGQRAILTSYGVTEEFCGCPIRAAMDTVQIGVTKTGRPIYMDHYAAQADAIIAVNRIKAHTAFSGRYESGILKILTIGLGKQKGAELCHDIGFEFMHQLIPEFGEAILKNAPVIFGLGLIENAFDEICHVEAMLPDEILKREPELLEHAKSLMGRILLQDADVLIVDEIGKNISGEGADPHVTGLFPTPYVSGGGLKAQRSVALRLTPEAHGCAYGMGQFDIISRKFYEQIDHASGYANAMTSKLLCQCRVPMVFPSDRQAVCAAVKTCCNIDYSAPKIIRIRNTARLQHIQVSEALLEQVRTNPRLEEIGQPQPFAFDSEGNLPLLESED